MNAPKPGDNRLSPAVTAVTSGRRLVEPRQTEHWWCRRLLTEIYRRRLLAHWCSDSRHCYGHGFPDLMIIGPHSLIFREIKVNGSETTAEQDRWGWALVSANADWGIWDFPADWDKAIRELEGMV